MWKSKSAQKQLHVSEVLRLRKCWPMLLQFIPPWRAVPLCSRSQKSKEKRKKRDEAGNRRGVLHHDVINDHQPTGHGAAANPIALDLRRSAGYGGIASCGLIAMLLWFDRFQLPGPLECC